MWRRWLLAGAMLLALVGLMVLVMRLWQSSVIPAHQVAEHWYEAQAVDVTVVELPTDDAPHDNAIEWWYYNGHLSTGDGERYAFHYTVFAINALATHTVAHASFIDLQSGAHFTSQKRTAGNPSRGVREGFDFDLGDWYLLGGGGEDRLRVSTPEFSFNLTALEAAEPVMQGGSGLLDFGPIGSSYYYSRPRMTLSGAIRLGERVEQVTGLAWFDHQWGDFSVNQLGWDWFALQLDDGTDIMLYLLFDADLLPVLSSGTLRRDGVTTVLEPGDFAVDATEHWESEATGIRYPMGWTVRIPSSGMSIELEPNIRDSEFDGRETTYEVYWEGPVAVHGTHSGQGFVEMSRF